jgi:hypothetical protein
MSSSFDPSFIRLPKPGAHCPYTQLSRSALDLLVRPQKANNFRPPVVSKVVKREGTTRGIRLISYPSLQRYLQSREEPIVTKTPS